MKQRRERLYNKQRTADEIKRLIETYYGDLSTMVINGKPVRDMSIIEFFEVVRMIPYRMDKRPIEVIARPRHIIKHSMLGMDCKKKTVLIGSYLRMKHYPYRLIGSSSRPSKRVHHIFPQVKINNKWRNMDATYSNYLPFQPKVVTNYEILT